MRTQIRIFSSALAIVAMTSFLFSCSDDDKKSTDNSFTFDGSVI